MDYLLNYSSLLLKLLTFVVVLNLIINGLPSKPTGIKRVLNEKRLVLNLIINGLPSKPHNKYTFTLGTEMF